MGVINAGFFVCEPKIFDYIKDDTTIWERDPLENLAHQGQLVAFKHKGFGAYGYPGKIKWI